MADDILNMSLDDIIKKNAEKSKQAKQVKQAKTNKGKEQPKQKQQAGPSSKLTKVTQGGVGKKSGFGRVWVELVGIESVDGIDCASTSASYTTQGRQGRPKLAIATVRNDAAKREALDGGAKWKHDMFKQVAGAAAAQPNTGGRTSGAKLYVFALIKNTR